MYNLNNVKDMKVTEDFLTLDEKIRNCQISETFLNCKTRKFMDRLRNQCDCLPFNLIKENEKVENHVTDLVNLFI